MSNLMRRLAPISFFALLAGLGPQLYAQGTSVSPSSILFGNQLVGTTSPPEKVTVKNTGTTAVTITSVTAPSPFAAGTACNNKTLAANAMCTFNVTFKPTASGPASATLTVSFAAPTASQTVSLSGTGIEPVASVSPSSLTFPNQQAGTTSASMPVTLTNTGTAALTINSIGIGGTNPANFSETDNCGPAFPATLAIGAQCTIQVSFMPNATTLRSANLNINVAKPATSPTVPLSGTGTTPSASLLPNSLTFGNEPVGSTSTAKAVTLSNTGPGPFTITGIAIGGTNPAAFAETNNCGTLPANVAPGGNCTFSVTFKPGATGAKSATLSVHIRYASAPMAVSLSGTATATPIPPAITSANNTTFTVGVSGSFTVTATGSPTPTITQSGTLPTGVAFSSATGVLSGTPAQAGTFAITFTATSTAGAANQAFTLTVNKGNATVSLSNMTQTYTGAPLSPTVTTSPAGLTYSLSGAPDTNVGSYPVTATVTDPNYTGSASGQFVVNQATPVFSGLTPSQTIAVGTSSITLSGMIAAGGAYPPSGEMVSITINSSTVQANIGASGAFSTMFPTSSIPSSGTPYAIGYSYGGDGNLASASDTSTTLSVVDGIFSNIGNLDIVNQTMTLLNNGMVLIAGGYTTASPQSPVNPQLYNPATGTFSPTGTMSVPRSQHHATLLNNGTVLITGGNDSTGALTLVVEVYDPVPGTFTAVGNSPTDLIANTATLLNDGTVLFTGGITGPYGSPPTTSAWLYNPVNMTITATANPMNVARWNHTATLLNDGTVLIAGGQDAGFIYLASTEVYNPATQTFTLLTNSMNGARAFHTATLLNNGQVLLAGCAGGPSTSAELYDPTAQTFTATGNMSTARCYHTATLLNNGTALVAGGYDPSFNFPNNAELYDSVPGAFKATGSMNTGRYNFTATRLDNGAVLVVGGWTTGPTPVELYTPSVLTPSNLVSIAVPSQMIAAIGGTQRFVATGTFSDSSTHQLASVTWSATDRAGTNVAQISNDATNPGVAIAQSQGTATITACAGAICGSGTLTVGVLNYTQINSANSPAPGCCWAMAFDPLTNSTLLFGGVLATGGYSTLGDTWAFQGGIWSQLSPPGTSPPPREGPGMAYDAATGTVVMFGGSSGTFGACCDLSDTWIWNGTNWTQINTLGPPGRRFDGDGMAYDPATKKVVLFGGNTQGNTTYMGDTWTWDGVAETWTQMFPATSPSARAGHGMATDAAGNVVVFGGTDSATKTNLADTWVWNGTTWQQQSPATAPPARSGHSMAFDTDLNEVVLFGGYGFNDTWTWDGSNWTQLSPATAPPQRYSFGMDYDGAAHAVVIFGGFTAGGPAINDTWELTLAP
jgi:hypothetical protein